jgi:hypothetical protein
MKCRTLYMGASFDYVTLEMKSIVPRSTMLGCCISNNNEIRHTGKANFDKIDIFIWASSAGIIIFLNVPPTQYYLGLWSPQIT